MVKYSSVSLQLSFVYHDTTSTTKVLHLQIKSKGGAHMYVVLRVTKGLNSLILPLDREFAHSHSIIFS